MRLQVDDESGEVIALYMAPLRHLRHHSASSIVVEAKRALSLAATLEPIGPEAGHARIVSQTLFEVRIA